MKKEAITHGVLEDLANRNENWDKLDGVPEKVDLLTQSIEKTNANFIAPTLEWELYSITNTGTNYDNFSYTVRTPNNIFLKAGTIVQINKTYAYRIFSYVEDKFLNEWSTTNTTIPVDGYYRFILKKTSDEDLTNSIELAGSQLTLVHPNPVVFKDYVDNKKITTPDLSDELYNSLGYVAYEMPEITWELGTLGDGTQETSLTRMVSNYIKVCPGIVIGTADYSNADIACSVYDADKNFVLDTSWTFGRRVITTTEYGYIRIVMRYSDNRQITNIEDLEQYLLFDISSAIGETPQMKISKISKIIEYPNPLNASVKAVSHRGYSTDAPENTLSAYRLAKEKGFSYVECDVRMTSDGVPVLLHDESIDRTSNGTGNIADMTLQTARSYDFGSWFGEDYVGEQIPTLKEFLLLCRKLNLHPYLDLLANYSVVYDVVKKMGMTKDVTWLCSQSEANAILTLENKSRIGLIQIDIAENIINQAVAIQTDDNDIFVDVSRHSLTSELAEQCLMAGVPLEVWDWSDNPKNVVGLVEKGVTGITSDSINVNEVLLKSEGL